MEVASGCVVTLDYTVRLPDGTTVDSTGTCGPVSVMCGAGQLFPALEDGIVGMCAGDTRAFTISAEDAYGTWQPELVRTLPRDRLPPDLQLTVGEEYRAKSPDGRTLRFRLLDVGATEVRADFNSPYAGQELAATVTVLAVRSPTADEERRGRT
jgi:FKBP-type peptidyl-prolyl cis-trans isomerase SlyD